MARPREFDEEQALAAAMNVFWRRGYRDTSMRELLAAMEIGQGSFYETFGSKRELYLRALERFRDRRLSPLSALDVEHDVPGAFRRFFEALVESGPRRGCFLGSASVENAGADSEVSRVCRDGFERIGEAFRSALERARERGEIPADKDPEALANLLLTTFYGIQVLAKSRVPRRVIEQSVRESLRCLE